MAITRAKNELYLFYVSECKSGFVNEVAPPDKTQKETVKHHPDVQVIEPQFETPSNLQVSSSSVPTNPALSAYTVNTRVKHTIYGEGITSTISTMYS